MANYQLLKADIDAKVYENAQQKITGENLNSVLNAMVTTLGAEYQFAGVATTATNPGTPDAKVFYIAKGKGTYTNFGGLQVTEDDVVVLTWDASWQKVSTGIASQAKLTELESEVGEHSVLYKNPTECLFDGMIANGKWYDKSIKFIVIPLTPNAKIEIATNKGTYYTFLKSFTGNPTIGSTPDFSTGYSDRVYLNSGVTQLTAPNEDCFLYMYMLSGLEITKLTVNGNPLEDCARASQNLNIKFEEELSGLNEDLITLSNTCRKDYGISDGWIDDNGNYDERNAGEGKITNLIPLNTNQLGVDGVIVEGATVEVVHCYSDFKVSADTYIGKVTHNIEFLEGTKAIVIKFRNASNPSGYDNLKMVATSEVAGNWYNSPFMPRINMVNVLPIQNYNNLVKAIKGFYISGNVDVNSTYRVLFQYAGLGETLRVVVYDTNDSMIYTNYFPVDSDGYVYGEYMYTSSGVSVKIEANMKGIDAFAYDSFNKTIMLSKKAFADFSETTKNIPILKRGLEEAEMEIQHLSLDMNDAEKIVVKTGETKEEDWSYYFDDENGGSSGYVLSTTGAQGPASDMRRTGFVLCNNCEQIKTLSPVRSGAGTAFYDKDKNPINYDGKGNAGYGDLYRNKWVAVPKDAVYVRTTYSINEQPVFKAKVYEKMPLQERLDGIDSIETRVTNVLCGYEGFNGMDGARVSLNQPIYSESVKQIEMKTEQCINRTQLEATVIPTSSDCHVGVGYAYSLRTEVRVKSNIFEIYYVATASDTYEETDGTIVFTDTLPFTITSGKMYRIGIYKTDSEPTDNGEYPYLNGARFYVEDVETGQKYEKYIQKSNEDGSQYNGVRSGAFTICIGKAFLTLKKGSCEVVNICLTSNYNPHAKVVIVGDSFVAGDTMINYGLENRYCALLQNKVGYNDMVIVGKGGEDISASTTEAIKYCLRLFKPEYFILALGTNNYNFVLYKEEVEKILKWCDIVGIKPILVTVTPRNGNYNFIDAANPYIRSSGRRYVDINKAVTSDSLGHTWKNGYVQADGTHPSLEGHRAMFEAFCRELPEIFVV